MNNQFHKKKNKSDFYYDLTFNYIVFNEITHRANQLREKDIAHSRRKIFIQDIYFLKMRGDY